MTALAYALARKFLGVVLVLIGVPLLVLPGPGILFILGGLTMLGFGPEARAFGKRAKRWVRGVLGRDKR